MLAAIIGSLAALDALAARRIALSAIPSARVAAEELAGGEVEAAGQRLTEIVDDLREAESRLGRVWLIPFRYAPYLGTELRAGSAGITGARATSQAALELVGFLEADRPPVFDSGRVSPEALELLRTSLDASVGHLREARAAVEGAPPPRLEGTRERLEEVDRVSALAIEVAEGLSPAVTRLGEAASGGTPYRALLVVENGAELRATGGLAGLLAVLQVDGNGLAVARTDLPNELEVPGGLSVPAPRDYLDRYGIHVDNHLPFLNLNLSPDFPTVAELTAAQYEEVTGVSVESVAHVDLVGLGYLLGAFPSVTVEGQPLEADELARDFLVDSYLRFQDPGEHSRYLRSVVSDVVDQILSGTETEPRRLLEALRSAFAERRLAVWSPVPEIRQALSAAGVDGALQPGDPGQADVILQNMAGNKLDLFNQVEMRLEVEAEECLVESRLEIDLTNQAPDYATDLPDFYWYSRGGVMEAVWWVNLYLPREASLSDATKDGESALGTQGVELGRPVVSTFARALPGETVTVALAWWEVASRDDYRLRINPQPMVSPPMLRVGEAPAEPFLEPVVVPVDLSCTPQGGP